MRHRKDKCVCISLDTWCGMICGKFFARDVAALFCERGLNNIEGHTVPLIMYTLFHCVYSKLPGRDLLYCWRHPATPL